MKNYFFLFASLAFVCSCSSLAKKKKTGILTSEPIKHESGFLHNRISDFMNSNLVNRGFNGSILVAQNDTIIYEKYVGTVHLGKKDSINETTSIQLASTGKTITAVAILQMVQDGKISLEDTLGKFFQGFPYPGITIKMLLSHQSGLPNYLYFITDEIWDKTQNVTNRDVLELLFSRKPNLYFKPGSRFGYSNTNFVLLALIIEKISGKKFPEYMKEQFFEPLNMKHTYVFTQSDSAAATPSFTEKNQLWRNDFLDLTYGDKNIYSSPEDLFCWSHALFNYKIIDPVLLDSAFTPQQFGLASQSKEIKRAHFYGLGFRIFISPAGKKVIYHFGRWHGFNAAFARLPDEKITIIILGNKFNRSIYYTAWKAYNLFGNYIAEPGQEDEDLNEPVPAKKSKIVSSSKKKPGPKSHQIKKRR